MELQEVITRLREIKEYKGRILDEERRLSTPVMRNMKDIPMVLGYCEEAYRSFHPEEGIRRSEMRRVSIFILLFLFSPQTLAGGKMGSGIREGIANAMGIESSNISHYHSNIWFYYRVYESFRNDVNNVFNVVFEKLRQK